jgi:hypothetical protein
MGVPLYRIIHKSITTNFIMIPYLLCFNIEAVINIKHLDPILKPQLHLENKEKMEV